MRIKELRIQHGFTQVYIANYLGINVNIYRYYEKVQGRTPAPIILKLIELYGTTADYLLGIKNEQNKR